VSAPLLAWTADQRSPLQSRRHMEMMDAMGLEDAEGGEVLPISEHFFFFFFTFVTGHRRSLSRKLSDTRVYEPEIRAI